MTTKKNKKQNEILISNQEIKDSNSIEKHSQNDYKL